ncbi:tetratricopeptide repeat protein [Terasakiispira papahanaumokuakeensis]|nr:tetratricopeptide repeat protein [Terasakiispira papahanaumokuakeensis]
MRPGLPLWRHRLLVLLLLTVVHCACPVLARADERSPSPVRFLNPEHFLSPERPLSLERPLNTLQPTDDAAPAGWSAPPMFASSQFASSQSASSGSDFSQSDLSRSKPPAAAFSCDVVMPVPPQNLAQWQQVKVQLSPLVTACDHDPQFLSLLGAAQLNTGALDEALKTLERALMLDPQQGGARIDYAQALFLTGQPFAALDLNHELLSADGMPDRLRERLQARRKQWRAALSQWHQQLMISVGRDTNLNSAPDQSVIRLTLPETDLALSLSGDDRPKAGNTLRLFWGLRYEQQKTDGRFYAKASLNSRNTHDTDFSAHQLALEVGRHYDTALGQLDLSLSGQGLQYGGSLLYTGLDGALDWLAPVSGLGCQPGLSGNLLYQRFPGDRGLDGREQRFGPALECQWGRFNTALKVHGILNQGVHSDRIGGDRDGWNAEWQMAYPVASGQLSGSFGWTQLEDRRGYSPLLDDGAPRQIRQYHYAAQYLQPIGPSKALTLSVQRRIQRSNLALFEHQNTQYEVGILWIF